MIKPASEIEFPPSQALRTKARMLVRLERLIQGSHGVVSEIAQRLDAIDSFQAAEIETFSNDQKSLLENMKRLVQN